MTDEDGTTLAARLRDANVNADCGGVVRGCCQGRLMLEAADEIERLRWLPEKTTNSRDPWDAGWNRCLEYILDKRAGIKPGDGEHE